MTKILILLLGVPGCGKSTWYTQNYTISTGGDPRDSWVLCSADQWFERTGTYRWSGEELFTAHRHCMAKAHSAMRAGAQVVVIDNTNIKGKDRKPYLLMAQEFGYEVYLRVFPMPETNRNVHGVEWEQVQRMQQKIQFTPGWHKYSLSDMAITATEAPCHCS